MIIAPKSQRNASRDTKIEMFGNLGDANTKSKVNAS